MDRIFVTTLLIIILNFQICFTTDKNYGTTQYKTKEYISAFPDQQLGERLLSNDYQSSNGYEIQLTYSPIEEFPNIFTEANISDISFEVNSPEKINTFQKDSPLKLSSIKNNNPSKSSLNQGVSPLKITQTYTIPTQEKPATPKPTQKSFPKLLKDFMTRQMQKRNEACSICYEKFTNNPFNVPNKCHPNRKIKLPCCMQDICYGCKDLIVQKSNGIEVMIENQTPNDVVKCIECPYCSSLVPQDTSKNGLILKIKNDSVKLHEQLELMKSVEIDVLNAMIADAKNEYLGNFGYWPVLRNYIKQHDPLFYSTIKALNQKDFSQKFPEELKILQRLEFEMLVSVIMEYQDMSYWPELRKYIEIKDKDLFSLIQEIEFSMPRLSII